ncbi:MAG: ATP-binding protein [Planctomycetota bacterium]
MASAGQSTDNGTVPGVDPHVTIELLSQPRYLSGARDLVAAVSKRFGFNDSDCGRISLAVDEALCNVIRHGYDRSPDGRIWVRVWPIEEGGEKPAGICVVIDDEAAQVDPTIIKGRDLDDVRPGGLGVYIMREVMTSVHFERRSGQDMGMRLVMTKLIDDQSEKAARHGS